MTTSHFSIKYGPDAMDLPELAAVLTPRTDGVFALADPGRIWFVTEGMLDLFAASEEEGGRWTFLCRVGTGSVLCGARLDGPTLVGKPLPGGAVQSCMLGEALDVALPRVGYGAGEPTSRLAKQLADGLDAGFVALADAVRTELPPREFVPLETDSASGSRRALLPPGAMARSVDGVVWIEVIRGSVALALTDFDETDGSARPAAPPAPPAPPAQPAPPAPPARPAPPAHDPFATIGWPGRGVTKRFLVTESDWVRSADGATVGVLRTPEVMVDPGFAEEVLSQQRLLMRRLTDRMHSRRSTARREMNQRRKLDAETLQRSSQALASVLDPFRLSGSGDFDPADQDAYLAVARVVGHASGVEVTRTSTSEASDARLGAVERIAVSSRFRTREVRLDGDWWRTDLGPLFAHLGSDATEGPGGPSDINVSKRTPVALIWHRGRYQVREPGGRTTRVGRSYAARLEPIAWMFYPPLPDEPLDRRALIRFGLRGSARDAAVMIGLGLAAALLGLLVPVLTGKVLGVLVPHADRGPLTQVCVVLFAAALLSAVLSAVQNLSLLRLEGRFEARAQAAVWDRLLRLPTSFFNKVSTGELSNSAMGISTIRDVLSGITTQVVLGCLMFITNMSLLFFYSVPLALMALALALGGGLICLIVGIKQIRWQKLLTEHDHKLAGILFQMLGGLSKLRVAVAEDRAFSHWALGFAGSRRLSSRARRLQNVVTIFNSGYLLVCTLLLFALVGGPASHQLSTSAFLTFNSAYGMMLAACIQITGSVTMASAVGPLFDGLQPVISEVPEVSSAKESPGDLYGEIEVSNVSFRYHDDQPPVLHDVSFQARPGEFVAIVGPTGCGKSTLLRLLIGFDEPTTGAVLYDGMDLSSLDVTAVRRQCGVVLQNGQLFAGSILSNICGMGNYSLDEAWEAAEMAGLDEDLGRMPMGMHTVLSEGATTLSAGQRQRLMIARALIGRPRILFFDEATSALDNRTQEIVTQSMRRLNASRIVIAHRLSTVMRADRVLVLDAGRLVQSGSPDELLQDKDGMFYRLVQRQMS
ncbi:NHLM bacteriocin system ABC transporter, ATP-binding protein [Actinacidiphila yanglinensis]|uniref:NHLM bacteriocin system ABC transporter, ATP-binding protein n=1 Tax=Actinacidiphila yanglinensis TaxID=310779 RepID=A0A1H5YUK6_9ACTN|nr:NHLP bacteriocin export ABC transporter permease/ATPase subunit [Actinacidiphila yanglinensis]SEG27923.1 NHLM bacteriocin system ABC transporter, ATP-binding protein [Actinacidiphila yanglinensis]